jgi:hypothetical protein
MNLSPTFEILKAVISKTNNSDCVPAVPGQLLAFNKNPTAGRNLLASNDKL